MRKLLLTVLLGLSFVSPCYAFSWWVPGHYQGSEWIGGHTRGQAGWLAPHEDFNFHTGSWNYIPGHYVNPFPRLNPAQHLVY
jgi:hypothetical protein